MRWLWLALLVLLGCDSPSVAVQDVAATRLTLGGHVFSVRVEGAYVEAIRVNPVWPPPSAASVTALAVEAMERVSGCTVKPKSVKGDAAIQKARLSC